MTDYDTKYYSSCLGGYTISFHLTDSQASRLEFVWIHYLLASDNKKRELLSLGDNNVGGKVLVRKRTYTLVKLIRVGDVIERSEIALGQFKLDKLKETKKWRTIEF